MKISEQARKAASQVRISPEINHPKDYCRIVIQQAIDSHERDLVEAAEKYLKSNSLSDRLELKAALDRRKE